MNAPMGTIHYIKVSFENGYYHPAVYKLQNSKEVRVHRYNLKTLITARQTMEFMKKNIGTIGLPAGVAESIVIPHIREKNPLVLKVRFKGKSRTARKVPTTDEVLSRFMSSGRESRIDLTKMMQQAEKEFIMNEQLVVAGR